MGNASKVMVDMHRAETTWEIFESLYTSNLYYNQRRRELASSSASYTQKF